MKKSLLDKFIWNNLIVFILLSSGGALNYVFQIILGRTLSPDQYGSFNSLLSMSTLFTAPVTILHLVLSRFIARINQDRLQQIKALLIKSFKTIFSLIGGVMLIGLLAVPWFKSFLHIETTLPIVLMLLAACFSTVQQVLVAVCEGMHRFLALGIISGGGALMRVFFVFFFVTFFGWGVEGGLLAVAFASFSAVFYGIWQVRDVLRAQARKLSSDFFSEMGRYSIPAFFMTTMVVIMCNIDIILVRHYCPPEQTGYYATAAILGRIAFFLPSSLLMVLFPSVSKATISGRKDGHYLWISIGLTTILSGAVFLVFFLAGKPIIELIYGDQYFPSAPILKIVTAAMGLLAISQVIFSYGLARSEFGFLWPLAGGGALLLFLAFLYHESAETIAWILLLSTTIIFFGTILNRIYLSFSKTITST